MVLADRRGTPCSACRISGKSAARRDSLLLGPRPAPLGHPFTIQRTWCRDLARSPLSHQVARLRALSATAAE